MAQALALDVFSWNRIVRPKFRAMFTHMAYLPSGRRWHCCTFAIVLLLSGFFVAVLAGKRLRLLRYIYGIRIESSRSVAMSLGFGGFVVICEPWSWSQSSVGFSRSSPRTYCSTVSAAVQTFERSGFRVPEPQEKHKFAIQIWKSFVTLF